MPTAIDLNGQNSAPPNPYIFPQVIMRDNVIRSNDGATGAAGAIGINLKCCDVAIVEMNVIDIVTDNLAIQHSSTRKVATFKNQRPSGVFLAGYDTSTQLHDGDLVTDAEMVVLGL